MIRTARLALVALVVALVGALATPANAVTTGTTATLMCGGGQVKAMAPAVYTDRNETVFWTTTLYAYTSRGWVQSTGFSPMAYSGSVNGRTGGWYLTSNYAQLTFRNYSGLAQGAYAVGTWVYTASSGWSFSLATYGSSIYCSA